MGHGAFFASDAMPTEAYFGVKRCLLAEASYITLLEIWRSGDLEIWAILAEFETRLAMRMFTVMPVGNGITIEIPAGPLS